MIDQYIRQFGKRLYGLCLSLCANTFDADDLYQDTWLRVVKNISQYDPNREFEPWLTKICVNTFYRKGGRLSALFRLYLCGRKAAEWVICMKKTTNILLVFTVIIPLVLLFWPFATWNDAMSLILRVIPSLAVQVLLCRIGKLNIIKAIPALLTGAFAAWGTYLYFTSPHWSNATVGDLVADYVSPFACCIVVLAAYMLTKKKK